MSEHDVFGKPDFEDVDVFGAADLEDVLGNADLDDQDRSISAISLDDDPLSPVKVGKKGKSGKGGSSGQQNGEDSEVPADIEDYLVWAFDQLGSGLFQRRGTILVVISNALVAAQILAHVFVSLPPTPHDCDGSSDTCRIDCSLPEEDQEFLSPQNSLTAEFHLVCESSWFVPMLGTVFFFGFLLGVTIFGSFADRRGRRPAYLLSLCITEVGAILTVIMPRYSGYALARGLVGFGSGGYGLVAYVWLAEFISAQKRPFMIIAQNVSFAVAVAALSPLAYVLPQWRWFLLVLFFCGLPPLVLQKWVLESPKWLAGSAGRLEDAHSVLCQISMINGVPALPPPPLPRATASANIDSGGASESKHGTLKLLVCDSRLSWRFTMMCLAWFALSFGYYGVSMNAGNVGSNVYVSSAVLALVEVPIHCSAPFLVREGRLGRRGATSGGLLVGGICCLLCLMSSGSVAMLSTFAFLGKAAISLGFGVVYLFAAELFPTSIRSRAMGLQSLCARIGGLIAPFVADLGNTSASLPFAIFGAPCVVAGLLLLTLPETVGKPLVNTIDDMQAPAKRPRRPCLWRYRGLEDESLDNIKDPPPAVVGANSF